MKKYALVVRAENVNEELEHIRDQRKLIAIINYAASLLDNVQVRKRIMEEAEKLDKRLDKKGASVVEDFRSFEREFGQLIGSSKRKIERKPCR
jgi:hypothetical protein